MYSIDQYITQLNTDKETLVDNLVTKGVEASDSETFTTLAPKVLDIQTGGGIDDYFATTNVSGNADKGMYYIKKIADIESTGTDLQYLFYNLKGLTELPNINMSNATSLKYFASDCSNIKSVPQYNTQNVTDFSYAFRNCSNLETIPVFDTSSATILDQMFTSCVSLTDTSLDNILQMCINATNITQWKTLYNLGIRTSIYSSDRIQALPHYADFVAAGWSIS